MVWGGEGTPQPPSTPHTPQWESYATAPRSSPWKRTEAKGGLLILLTLPITWGLSKGRKRQLVSHPVLQHLGTHSDWEARLREAMVPGLKAVEERKNRAVSSHRIPGAMLASSQLAFQSNASYGRVPYAGSQGGALPTVRVMTQTVSQLSGSAGRGLHRFLPPLRSEKEKHWKH